MKYGNKLIQSFKYSLNLELCPLISDESKLLALFNASCIRNYMIIPLKFRLRSVWFKTVINLYIENCIVLFSLSIF